MNFKLLITFFKIIYSSFNRLTVLHVIFFIHWWFIFIHRITVNSFMLTTVYGGIKGLHFSPVGGSPPTKMAKISHFRQMFGFLPTQKRNLHPQCPPPKSGAATDKTPKKILFGCPPQLLLSRYRQGSTGERIFFFIFFFSFFLLNLSQSFTEL